MDSINEQVKRCNSLASGGGKNSKKSSQLVETFNEDENGGVKPDNVVVFTQKLVSGELTEQLMRFFRDSEFFGI